MRRTAAFPTLRCGSASSGRWSAPDVRMVDVPFDELPAVLSADLLPHARALQPGDLARPTRRPRDRACDRRDAGEQPPASRSNHCRAAGRLLAVDRMGVSLPALWAD